MTSKKKISPIVKFGAWMLSFIVFLVGFWHSHLGLIEMRPFESEYGSLIVAGIFLLLILISYNIAINGKKSALIFYIVGGFFFFIFNLNYFYPSYLGRKLINEETDQIKETLTIQRNNLNSVSKKAETKYQKIVDGLIQIKSQILKEIEVRGGFGVEANKRLNEFNQITDSKIRGERKIETDPIKQLKLYKDWENELNQAIRMYIGNTIAGDEKNKLELVYASYDMDDLFKKYKPILDSISNDNERIHLDSLNYENYNPNKQIKILKSVVDKSIEIDKRVNATLGKTQESNIFPKDCPNSRNIGNYEHTLSSINQRINKIDTWGIILLCLFIDLLVPLFIYLMIRKTDDEEDENYSFWNNITGKKKPSTF